jgi:hypothetical protein
VRAKVLDANPSIQLAKYLDARASGSSPVDAHDAIPDKPSSTLVGEPRDKIAIPIPVDISQGID